MIKNIKAWEEFENEWISNSKLNYYKNFEIFEKMKDLASSLGKFPLQNRLYDIEIKINIAKILKSLK